MALAAHQELAKWPPDSAQAQETRTQIARALGLQRKFDAAHAVLDAVEAKLDTLPGHVRVHMADRDLPPKLALQFLDHQRAEIAVQRARAGEEQQSNDHCQRRAREENDQAGTTLTWNAHSVLLIRCQADVIGAGYRFTAPAWSMISRTRSGGAASACTISRTWPRATW